MVPVLIGLVVIVIVIWLRRAYSYWSKKGVPGPEPRWIVGNLGSNIIRQKSFGDIVTEVYRKYDGSPLVGIYRMLTPCLVVRDFDFLKTVEIKDFSSFHDNDIYVDMNADVILGGNPFVLKGEEWKEKRTRITNAFTSGKIKAMFASMTKAANQMIDYLNKVVEGRKQFETLDFSSNYTLQTVLTCAYGIEVKVFEEPDSRFVQMGKKILQPTTFDGFLFYLASLYPKITKFVKFNFYRFANPETTEQVCEMLRAAFDYREKNNMGSKDFLGSLAPLISVFGENSVLSLASAFFVDGQATTGLAMGCLLHDLAQNPDVQEKLRAEVNEYFEKDNGQLSYESIQEMPYLDACFKGRRFGTTQVKTGVAYLINNFEISLSRSADHSYKIDPWEFLSIPIGGFKVDFEKLQKRYDAPVVGFYRMLTPCIIVKDMEPVKSITVKDFGHFRDNEFYVSIESDAAFGGNPFAIHGDEWKQKRSHITGSFTSGKSMNKYLKRLTEHGPKVFEAKELSCLYTLETVLSCAYGVEAHVFDKPNSHFFEMGQKLYYSEYLGTFKFFLSIIFPKIAKFIGTRFTNKQTEAQLFEMIRTSLEHRDKSNTDVKDFMSTIASLRSRYNEKEILALATAFYLDGQETTGLVMGHLLYELAANPEAQKKLRNEVMDYFEKDGGQLTYESIQDMPYLDACFKDGSRPPLVIEKGTPVMIPLYGIHYDPKHYQDPCTFKPERFLDSDVKQYLLGFGDGPRACIGRRFGIAQVKAGVAYLIKDFELSVNQKTKLPLKTDAWDFLVVSTEGVWLDFKKLN
nr:unnamed protein product [Callosobruchus chinensis]